MVFKNRKRLNLKGFRGKENDSLRYGEDGRLFYRLHYY
jgi:hypothetical protein